MLFARIAVMLFGLSLMVLAWNACGQWSPDAATVYMGDLNLALSSASNGSAPANQPSLNNPTSNTTINNATTNNTTANNTAVINSLDEMSGMQPLDLSHYASDRTNKNLTGYKNIMYPISESRGTSTTTAGAGGCGCSG
jgi:hypothetical protein